MYPQHNNKKRKREREKYHSVDNVAFSPGKNTIDFLNGTKD
jgi:hypothetical protein